MKPSTLTNPPPHDVEAEKQVIGAAFLDVSHVMYECSKAGVRASTFFDPVCAEIWAIIEAQFVSLGFLDQCGVSRVVGKKFDMDKCIDSVSTAAHAGFYIRRIKDMELRRGLCVTMTKTAERLADIQTDTAEVLGEYESASTALLAIPDMQIRTIGDFRKDKLEQWSAAKDVGFVGIPCHISQITSALGGWRKGCLSIIGAYRGTGKSTFMRSEAKFNAKASRPVALFSLEDPGDIAAASMVCDEADVSSLDLDTGVALAGTAERADRAWQTIGNLPLYMVAERCSLSQIVAASTILKKRHNIQAIYIDHIQYIYPLQLPGMNRNDTISSYSADLAALAKKLDLSVIAASQLSRGAERENRAPRLSDLRDSGSLEQDARAVGLLYWSEEDDCFIFEIAKNNYGKSGVKVKLWRKAGKRFEVPSPTDGLP